jgi:hypothetical protein
MTADFIKTAKQAKTPETLLLYVSLLGGFKIENVSTHTGIQAMPRKRN